MDSEYDVEVTTAGDYLLRAKRDDGKWVRAWFESMDGIADEIIVKVDESRGVDILAEFVSGNQDADSADESNGG